MAWKLHFIALYHIRLHYITLHYGTLPITSYLNCVKYIHWPSLLTYTYYIYMVVYVDLGACTSVPSPFTFDQRCSMPRFQPTPTVTLRGCEVRVASPVCSASCHLHQGATGRRTVTLTTGTGGVNFSVVNPQMGGNSSGTCRGHWILKIKDLKIMQSSWYS